MSRSYRRPYSAVTGCRSAGDDKRIARRAYRHLQNQVLKSTLDWDDFSNPDRFEAAFNDTWSWGRDGKQTLQFPPDLNRYLICFDEESWALKFYVQQIRWYEKLKRK